MAPPPGHNRRRRRKHGGGGLGLGLDGANLMGQMSAESAAVAAAANVDPLVASESSYDSGGYAVSSYDDDCCPGVVDPITLFSTLAFIAGGTLLLRQIVITTLGRRRRRRREATLADHLLNVFYATGIVVIVLRPLAQSVFSTPLHTSTKVLRKKNPLNVIS